ncbi:MAG TPA: DUF262 domain-containing protein [Pyrinomonadaceae bacterium]|nr:DUF262 domain-containing protein [Pyrinomonadaceae bacterium]
MIVSAPAPEVQYLPHIFRRIQSGDIKIPAFQRTFIWTEAQVLELLNSIYRGFPIGSVLFWRVDEKVFKIAKAETTSFPETPEDYPLNYVIDGLQRLSTLYGCFHWKQKDKANIFNVIFDLDHEEFMHFDERHIPEHYIHLSSIFSPKTFLEAQSQLMNSIDSDLLLNRAINLHSTFQEYLIPLVTISGRDLNEVVSIFERVNSTGTRLSAVDFLRAVTWAEEFDLSNELESISEVGRSLGFDIPFETLAKILAISLNIAPTAESMVELRNYSPNVLHVAVNNSKQTLRKALGLLKDACSIYSYDYIPYEGQLLVIVKYTQEARASFDIHVNDVMKWFWITSFNEGLRGKPDNYVARTLEAVNSLIAGDVEALKTRLTLAPEDLIERRFIRGKALSSAVANLFALTKARSLTTGELINPETYMTDFSSNNYESILSSTNIPERYVKVGQSNKLIASVVLIDKSEKRYFKTCTPKAFAENLMSLFNMEEAHDILDSQMIPLSALRHLIVGDYDAFLHDRARYMYDKIINLTEPGSLLIG